MLVEYFAILGNRGSHSEGLPVLASSATRQVVASVDNVTVGEDDRFVHRNMAVWTASIGYSDGDFFQDLIAAVTMFGCGEKTFVSK